MRAWQFLLGVFVLVSLSCQLHEVISSRRMNGFGILWFPSSMILNPFTMTGDRLRDCSSSIDIHWSRWQLVLADTAPAPGLPCWPILEGIVDHLQWYQVGAANIESPTLRHGGLIKTISIRNSLIYLAIVASVSKNKWHLVVVVVVVVVMEGWEAAVRGPIFGAKRYPKSAIADSSPGVYPLPWAHGNSVA